ncbi:hypothetical protein BDV11DRAFT_63014 [Aspergillus similis]
MSGYQRTPQAAVLDCDSTQSLQDGAAYPTYGQPVYMSTPLAPSPMTDHISQMSDCIPYMAKPEYASSYEDEKSPMITAEPCQLPEVISYSPQRGSEGTRVFVQLQSPYDLHTTPYATLYIVFGSKKCECNPHFLGFRDSAFQYALSVDTPPFMSTGSPSLAVPLQIAMGGQNECPATTLQVGVYTYENAGQQSPSEDGRKRRISSFSADGVSRPIKRASTLPVQVKEEQSSYAAPYSPYLQPLPSINGFAASYHTDSSPRMGATQYTTVSTNSQPSIRAPSPMAPSPMAPSWNSSFLSVNHDQRGSGYAVGRGVCQPKPSSPASFSNPTLIRTSTLQQSTGVVQTQSFNPYAMYPSKAVLKLNGDLNTMTHNWTREEQVAQRRLVQFTRMQSGSTIHADFKPVSPEERAPNSICISCIYWDGKDECFITSVDTIYLLESLVGVRFTVEEKNRIRRNLEGFRPLTVSKSKADSEEFFKVIMGFPAPKPRNIEKDVKVFPWKILGHALKKIIGKYSASYSSTAGALPTPIGSNYPSTGPASDSGADGQSAASPQSISDGTPSSSYHTSNAVPIYSPPTETDGPIRTILPAVSQSYSNMTAPYSYTTVCHSGQAAPSGPATRSWELNQLTIPSTVNGHPTPGNFNYMPPMTYSQSDYPQGH